MSESESRYHALAMKLLGVDSLPPQPLGLPDFNGDSHYRHHPGGVSDTCEQQIAALVCTSTNMTPEVWRTLSEAERLPWLERAKPLAPGPILDEAKVLPDDVPAEFREGGKPRGEILTVPYLIGNREWPFKNRTEFANAYRDKKLTRRIKVGRAYAYSYNELAAMWRDDSLKE